MDHTISNVHRNVNRIHMQHFPGFLSMPRKGEFWLIAINMATFSQKYAPEFPQILINIISI